MKRRTSLILITISLLYLLFGLAPGRALAQAAAQVETQVETPPANAPTPSDDAVNAIASEMYCPVCENIPLDQCSTQACYDWRELIRQKLAEGKSAEQIKAYFAAQYGDKVLSEPPRRGLNWLLYLLPPAVLILAGIILVLSLVTGGIILYLTLKKGGINGLKKVQEKSPAAASGDDEFILKLEEELKKRERE
jgi:cytochrome c-type biogenesis protein CcmH